MYVYTYIYTYMYIYIYIYTHTHTYVGRRTPANMLWRVQSVTSCGVLICGCSEGAAGSAAAAVLSIGKDPEHSGGPRGDHVSVRPSVFLCAWPSLAAWPPGGLAAWPPGRLAVCLPGRLIGCSGLLAVWPAGRIPAVSAAVPDMPLRSASR